MKLKFLLPSVIFLFCGLMSRAQVHELYYQGFETSSAANYTVTPSTGSAVSTTYYMSGSRSLELVQSTTEDVTLMLAELDLTSANLSTSNYISLEFDHICEVVENSSQDYQMCRVFYKRSNEPETQWHQLTSQLYNRVNGGSSEFARTSAFTRNSYSEWIGTTTNEMWRSERFDMNDVLSSSVAQNERKLMLKFVVRRKVGTGAAGRWRLDNVSVKVSPSPMVRPKITMTRYPDGLFYPNSRLAHVELDATTSLSQGINPDSVYMYYTVGSDPTPVLVPMTPVTGVNNRYSGDIPFFGYDTVMRFYCVARDATTNANKVTFPAAANSWVTFRYVRGVDQLGVRTGQFTGTTYTNHYPFGWEADGRSEWVYDSALLASAGYGPGGITSVRFSYGSQAPATTRPRMQIRMKNVPTNFEVDTSISEQYKFTTSYMHVVYDGPMNFSQGGPGTEQTIEFQDTFFYAGKDLVMQVIFDDDVDHTALPIHVIPTLLKKKSIWFSQCDSEYGYNAFTTANMNLADRYESNRPAMVLTQHKNMPLLYDLGISELVNPSYTTAMTQRPGSLTVKLKNFGALPVNAIRVSYNIDDTVFGHYDWTGTLAGGAEQNVVISNNINLPAGFHRLSVWVEDTLTASGVRIRDHEPYNDTSASEFIVCDGPMNGVRNIGGANAHFNTVEEFLFSLSRCGIDDSLVVRLAPGIYPPFVMPAVNGLTQQHYIAFEPQSGSVTFVATGGTTNTIVNLQAVDNIRFRNIKFVRRDGALSEMVTLGTNSLYCRFEGCTFVDSLSNPAASMRINTMINPGYTNYMTVDGCTFVGGKTALDLRGTASDNLATGNTVVRSIFRNQYESAISVQYQQNFVIDSNQMYDVLSNSSYVLMVNSCSGASRITRNKLYTSHGAGALGVSGATGTASTRFLIANNMAVCADDGSSSLVRSTFNIIQVTYADVVYNSVKLSAPTRSNVAAASFGGGLLQNSRFMNNVVVALDNTSNYALNYTPGSGSNNTVSNNVYFSLGTVLNRYAGSPCMDISEWRDLVTTDLTSVQVNPNFLNGSLVDLRTYNRAIKGVGSPMTTVPRDMFDSLRSTTATCPGAFEFVSLAYDFEPEALLYPLASDCHMPSQAELVVLLRNSGVNAYTGSGLSLGYKVNNGTSHTVNISSTVPAEDTVTIHTGATVHLPANGFRDSTYTISIWTIYANDPNQTNDTNTFSVTSMYSPSRPANDSVQIDYGTTVSLTPTTGINTWAVYNHTAAPKRKSVIYWYTDSTAAEPFFVGPTLTTDTVRVQREYYFRQRREQPIVRITQLEFSHANNTQGLTPSMPYWVSSGRKVALQLTNVGDAPACLYGDTIQTVSPTSNLNNKVYRFNDSIYLQPGQSLVVQWATGTSVNPDLTIHTGTPLSSTAIAYNSKVAIVYRHDGQIEDAVALNDINATPSGSPQVTWANTNVPTYVWNGTGVSITSNTVPGIIRTDFNGGASDWTIATAANPMFLANNRPSWIRYVDNGCDGPFATYKVKLIAPPAADIEVSAPQLPAMSCGLSQESVSVRVRNYGVAPVTSVVLNYTDGSDTVTETLSEGIAANGEVNYTFTQPVNLAYPTDTSITITVWANLISGDPNHANDTSSRVVTPLYTPSAPAALPARQIAYDTRDTITLAPVDGVIPVWYDTAFNPIDTGYTHISDIIYANGTYGYSHMVCIPHIGQVGTPGATLSKTAYPNPFQPYNKNAKQQYIYSASDLRSMGAEKGYIDTIGFKLDSIYGTAAFITFDHYTVSMGLTADTIFSANNDWHEASFEVFHRDTMVVQRTSTNQWVKLPLDSPFLWDGESSLIVQVVHENSVKYTNGVVVSSMTKNYTSLCQKNDNAMSPSTAEFVGNGSRANQRPLLYLSNKSYGCPSSVTPYQVTVTNIPAVDAKIAWPDGVDQLHYTSCVDVPLHVNIRNQGSSSVSGVKVYYTLDTLATDSITVSGSLASGVMHDVTVFNRLLKPGRHTVRVVVAAPGDIVASNDTIERSFLVSFCAGTYTINPTNGTFKSFGEAIDTLNVAGIEGPVNFSVSPAVYNEQVVLGTVPGSSSINTISFVGNGSADSVVLMGATSQANNYVFLIDSSSYVRFNNISFVSRPTATGTAGNYANVFVVNGGSNLSFDQCVFRVKGTVNNTNASAVLFDGEVSNVTFTNNTVDSGYYSFRAYGTGAYTNFIIRNNTFRNFFSQGINLRTIEGVTLENNLVRGGVTVSGRPLTGIYLAQTAGQVTVSKNRIYLLDNQNAGKRGIQLVNANGTSTVPIVLVNNMISCSGNGTQSLKPAGIWVDSSSAYVNIHFNTVRVYCGQVTQAYSENSYAFYSGATVSNIHLSNNILSNFSKGYASYVAELNTVVESNYNAYYTESERPFFWKVIMASFTALQIANSNDVNSLVAEPFFAANDDLHLVMTNMAGIGYYLTDVIDDIDGRTRAQIPGPTIGAHEMTITAHDLSVIRILSPTMPANLNFNYTTNLPENIESDPVTVMAEFYNNGQSPETSAYWYAYIEGHEATTRSANVPLGFIAAAESKLSVATMPTVLGIIDSVKVHVVVVLESDTSTDDNHRLGDFYLAPAYDLRATKVAVDRTGCNLTDAEVSLTVKNVGFKDIDSGAVIKIGYHPEITTPANIAPMSTMPDTVEETVILPTDLWAIGADILSSTTLTFNTRANLYPTDTAIDIKVRLRGWAKMANDITADNDTTSPTANAQSPIVDAYYSPAPPIGHDVYIPYATWGSVTAEQPNNRPIRWYRDTLAAPFYHPSQYNASCKWSNTPQYFSDSVYYLNCVSTKNCPSQFSTVYVHVNNPIANDVGISEILAPLGGRVYMENDTLRVRIENYGTSAKSNVPVHFVLKRGNNVIQSLTETCPANIPGGQNYVYTFNTLLDIPTPTQTQNYSLTVWTDLASDGTRLNDTLRNLYTFRSLGENTYSITQSSDPTFDISRVAFSEIDFDLPALGRGYTNLGAYTRPDYPVLHVRRGLSDTLFIQVTPLDATAQAERVRAWAYIDYNRSGTFTPATESIVPGTIFYNNETLATPVTIPERASTGYMRMRIIVGLNSDFGANETPTTGIPTDKSGHVMDFLLYVDPSPATTDLAVTHIVSPRNYIVDNDSPVEVSFRVANKGLQPVSNPVFNYDFHNPEFPDTTAGHTVTYNGTIAAGSSVILTIPGHSFPYGTSNLTIWHTTSDDANSSNDTLRYEYNRFYVITPPLIDDFEGSNHWYAPRGYNQYTRNYWQLGTPTKNKLNAAYSGNMAWVTDLFATINSGVRGNVSYLYSPIIDIHQIRADTIAVRVRRNLTNNSTLRLEFYNYERKWQNAYRDSLTHWYNNERDECFDGTTSGSGYELFYIPTFYRDGLSGDFNERLQFRFVYTTPMGSNNNASFGEGCAIDDIRIGRAIRDIDAGVVAIVEPSAPAYGQTIYPKVVIRNFGADTLTSIPVGYTHYGIILPRQCVVSGILPPGTADTFQLSVPFVISSRFPSEFSITAFTMLTAADIYRDNDTCTREFTLLPLDNDISAEGFTYPLDQVVAGDSLEITIRLRNFGASEITNATASYIVNNTYRVDEQLDFNELLGRPLSSMEYFNYTFKEKYRAPMGILRFEGIVKSPQNDYIYNDTIKKLVNCLTSITDLAASEIILDPTPHNTVAVSLKIDNRGARGANYFDVGFYINGDTNTIHRETYGRAYPLPALNHGYHVFNYELPQRAAGYNNVTAFVHVDGDNDTSNDTTSTIGQKFFDLEPVKIVVVENSQSDCRVYVSVRNNGNTPLATGVLQVALTINGETLNQGFSRRIAAGETVALFFDRHIAKNPTSSYSGSATITYAADQVPENNQTSNVIVRSSVEGVPTVKVNSLVLDQNFPNPHSGLTTVPFSLPTDAEVRFFVVDALGHVVNQFSQHYSAGDHTISLDLSNYPSGVYYYGIEVNGQRRMRKMTLR